MPITMTSRAAGMPAKAYDDVMAHLADALRRSDGFISHAAQVTPDGVTVTEVWESREQWERWFDAAVRPHLPPDTPEPVVAELHNAVAR